MRTFLPLASCLGLFLVAGCGNSDTSSSGGTGGSTSSGTGGTGGTGGGAECPTSVTPAAGTVITSRGAVVGAQAGATWVFKGIPYAEPPVGDLRWKRPTPHACWEDARPATEFGAKCVQIDANGAVVGQEDCLTLNVWTPADATADKPVPVLLFIHGGGNVQGASSVDSNGTVIYEGQAMSELGHVAVVTINYRLGPFGWLAHPAFAEGEPASSGNYGAADQVFALEWVKQNIGAFGGDPSKVMIFGESAGGQNVCTLLASPLAKGLFSSALVESGGCAAEAKDAAETFANDWAAQAKCDKDADPAKCMRAMKAEDVEKLVPAPIDLAGKQGPFQPIIDGWLLTGHPYDVLKAGTHNHVPVVMGNNENETGAAVPAMTEAEYTAAVNAALGAVAAQALAQYPAASYPTPRDAYVTLTSDAKFVCPTRRNLRALATTQTEPVYRYQFTHVLDNVGPAQKAKGSFHGLELFFVFGQLKVAGYVASPAEKDLSSAIQGYWSRFGGAGDPNGGSAASWPVYDGAKDPYLELDDTLSSKEGVHSANCDFWDSLVP
jgi:para-nitrobenzyl esterase